ncbi:SdiA-regulated domain-containing protein [filamentous cyanobacterium LEGE 11480]|uniref:SdiA-regulated domain-containing protein n=1 Tax=Romeriopsis navalis LEGE 11480 TaxID=2777977 RepID=A0A928VJN9_9CYAN|nr:SdiA-regulated domain-containing protein [Romeriopsis navalis]MBE9028973.1 SdiA-regulated domain-containing protein [Romeriopsis navalis LEGE 11480]
MGEGLCEPSGLALAHEKNALWTISDDTKKIFKLGLNGDLKKGKSLKIPDKGLEGIVLDPTGKFLLVVKEENNEIIKIAIETQAVAARQRLDAMIGYEAINYLTGAENKGLEGIAWNQTTGTLFVMQEGLPGLLLEVSSDLKTIQSHQLLNQENGFCDAEVDAADIDFSDICYDDHRNCFWIISDRAKRLFLYNWSRNTVLQSSRLGYSKNGKYREIEQAEGIAIDPDTNSLYIVSDKDARLYVFDIRE